MTAWERRDMYWGVGVVGNLPLLTMDPTPGLVPGVDPAVHWLALGATLVGRGFEPLLAGRQPGRAHGVLTIAGDHMEADWVGSGDPDTYEGLDGLEPWLEILGDEVLVVIGPHAADGEPMRDGAGWFAIAEVVRPAANR